jgi:hypothetical protein
VQVEGRKRDAGGGRLAEPPAARASCPNQEQERVAVRRASLALRRRARYRGLSLNLGLGNLHLDELGVD